MQLMKWGALMVAAALLSGCGDDSPKWMQSAWEHDVDQRRWQGSKDYVKVATAGLWLERLQEKNKLTIDKAIEDMEPEARKLTGCIDNALKMGIGTDANRVSRYSTMCVSQLGYGK